jgi:hypothetical protein
MLRHIVDVEIIMEIWLQSQQEIAAHAYVTERVGEHIDIE